MIKFKVPKPQNLQAEKELSDFKLKLAEYADIIKYDDSNIQFIEVELSLSDGIDGYGLNRFIKPYSYIGHV